MPLTPATTPTSSEAGQEYLWTLNLGPQHPATHTTLRLRLTLDGERVVDAAPDLGYLHSGFEKLGETLDYNQYVTVTDRMNYVSPIANNVAWHHAVETLLGVEVTPRCRYLRVLVSRVGAHQRPFVVRRRHGPGRRRLHVLPLRILAAGADLRHLRDALRGPLHQQLHSGGRGRCRTSRRW